MTTKNELAAALAEIYHNVKPTHLPGYLSTTQLVKASGKSRDTIRKWLRAADAANLLDVQHISIVNVGKGKSTIPVYKVLDESHSKSKKRSKDPKA
jgi:hypothetical protein